MKNILVNVTQTDIDAVNTPVSSLLAFIDEFDRIRSLPPYNPPTPESFEKEFNYEYPPIYPCLPDISGSMHGEVPDTFPLYNFFTVLTNSKGEEFAWVFSRGGFRVPAKVVRVEGEPHIVSLKNDPLSYEVVESTL